MQSIAGWMAAYHVGTGPISSLVLQRICCYYATCSRVLLVAVTAQSMLQFAVQPVAG